MAKSDDPNILYNLRNFRCDVLSELISWDVSEYDNALNFVSGVIDYWTRPLDKVNNYMFRLIYILGIFI